MSATIKFSIQQSKITFNEKGYANLTMFVSDETNQYGQNASVVESKTKEQVEAKEPTVYVGNGRVSYTENGTIVKADWVEREVKSSEQATAGRDVKSLHDATPDDLPF